MPSLGAKALLTAAALTVASQAKAECVVLLHGLARSDTSLALMEAVLTAKGYHVVNQDYPSTDEGIQELVRETLPRALAQCDEKPVHFVTHSMGAILVRAYFGNTAPDWLGHVVMLAPPNQGSELVDVVGELALYKWQNGPAGTQLGTDPDSVPNRLGPVKYSVGVIAGTVPLGALGAVVFEGPNDGKVTVESTKLDGMADHLTLPVSHTFLMNNPVVIAHTLRFLETGSFGSKLGVGQALGLIDPIEMVTPNGE